MMNKSDVTKIKDRWGSQQAIAGQAAILGKGPYPFPEMADGYADLRGLTISQFVRNSKIRLVDLSGAAFEGFGQFGMCDVSNARFCDASLQTNLGSKFDSCDFSSAKMSGAIMRGMFVNCNFSLTDLSAVSGNQVRFIKCIFSKSNLSKASFLYCTFEDCVFEGCKFRKGSLSFSKFIRSPIEESLLADTLMEKVVFQGS